MAVYIKLHVGRLPDSLGRLKPVKRIPSGDHCSLVVYTTFSFYMHFQFRGVNIRCNMNVKCKLFTIKLSTTSFFGVLKVQKQIDGLLSGIVHVCKSVCNNANMKNVRLLLQLSINKSVMNDSNHSPRTMETLWMKHYVNLEKAAFPCRRHMEHNGFKRELSLTQQHHLCSSTFLQYTLYKIKATFFTIPFSNICLCLREL